MLCACRNGNDDPNKSTVDCTVKTNTHVNVICNISGMTHLLFNVYDRHCILQTCLNKNSEYAVSSHSKRKYGNFVSLSPEVWSLKWIINAQFHFHVSQKHLNICRSPSPLQLHKCTSEETKKQLQHQCDDRYTWGCCHSGSNNNPCHASYWKCIESPTCGYAPGDAVVIQAVITCVMWATENVLNHWHVVMPLVKLLSFKQ